MLGAYAKICRHQITLAKVTLGQWLCLSLAACFLILGDLLPTKINGITSRWLAIDMFSWFQSWTNLAHGLVWPWIDLQKSTKLSARRLVECIRSKGMPLALYVIGYMDIRSTWLLEVAWGHLRPPAHAIYSGGPVPPTQLHWMHWSPTT